MLFLLDFKHRESSPYNRPLRPRGGVEVQLYSFCNLGARWGGWLTPRPGRFTPGKDPVQIVQEAGWAPWPVWTGAKHLVPTGIRSPDRPACSKLLYRLSYPGPRFKHKPSKVRWVPNFLY
jgi:hypothetical protein